MAKHKFIDIHNYDKQFKTTQRKVKGANISDSNKEALLKFGEDLFLKGVTKARIIKEVSTLRIVAEKIKKDFKEMSEKDLKKFIFKIHNDKDYSIHTKYDYNKIIKRFFKWFEGENKFYPNKVAWIVKVKPKNREIPRIKRSELIIEEEAHKLVETADNPRDKALIALVWDTGGRIGEIGSMTIGSLSFDDGGTIVHLRGKTGERSPYVIESTPHLVRWMGLHPLKDDPNAPLWVNMGQDKRFRNQPLDYEAFYKLFERLFDKAKVKKRFNPHLFRHSRATWCAINGWNSLEMCKFFGWEENSSMPSVYISMVQQDITNRMKETYGLKTDKAQKLEERKPNECPRCEALNPHKSRFCYKCGIALDLRTAQKLDDMKKKEEALQKELMKKTVNTTTIKGITDIRELMYQALKQDKNLVKKLKEIVG